MEEITYTLYTKEGYQKLVDELAYHKDVEVPEIKVRLAEARNHGDLSENSEYDEARDAQAKCYARIAELEELIKHAKIVDETEHKAGIANIGSVVKVKSSKTGKEETYTIVSSNEVDPFNNMISDHSPIGVALVGSKKGETVEVETPAGNWELTVISVQRAKK